MEKKFTINRVDLGSRVTGYEVFAPGSNGGEVYGYTPKMMVDGVKAGEVVGMVLNEAGELVLDEARGYKAMTVKTGIGTLTSTDPSSIANIQYIVYGREGDKFRVINSRFGRQTYCADKVKALLDLGAVSGVVLVDGELKCSWELDEAKEATEAGEKSPAPADKQDGKKK